MQKVSKQAQASFRQGNEAGELARDLFPGGVLIPYDGLSYDEQLQMTQKAMKTAKVIYEAAFSHDGVFIKADVLRKVRLGWELYEFKASTKVKDVYLDDVAVQYHVITGAGVTIKKAFVGHLNNSYVRKGALDLDALFVRMDVTAEAKERQATVKKEIAEQKKVLAGKMPCIDIG